MSVQRKMSNYKLLAVTAILVCTLLYSAQADSEEFPPLGYVKATNGVTKYTGKFEKLLENNPRLIYYGSYGSKAFFGESADTDWNGANSYCRDLNMLPASFASADESRYVYSITPAHLLWTAGVDVGNTNQVNWDTSKTPINLPLWGGIQRNTGVVFDARTSSESSGYVYTTFMHERIAYPLCQIES